MTIAQSRLTAQGRISIPAEIRKRLGLRPGSVLEWCEKDGEIVVRKAGRYFSAEIHEVLFGGARPRTRKVDVKDVIRKHIRKRHAGE